MIKPSKTPGGLKVAAVVHAPVHNRYFAVAKRPNKRSPSHFVIETMNKDGSFSKRQVKDLWNSDWETASEAKHAIRVWDLT